MYVLVKTLLTIGKPDFSKASAELFLEHPNNSEGGALCFYIHKKEKGKFVLYFLIFIKFTKNQKKGYYYVKKIFFSIAISFVLFFCSSPLSFAQEENLNYTQMIVEQVNQIDHSINIDDSTVVPLESGTSTYSSNTSNIEKGIRQRKLHLNTVEDQMIIPSKLDENGVLVNSFAYAEDKGKDVTISDGLVDLVVYVSLYYQKQYFFSNPYPNVYRHTGMTCRWYSGNPTVYVDNLTLSYQAKGIECDFNTGNPTGNGVIQKDSLIDQYNPTNNQLYSDWNNMMPANIGIYCLNGSDHGARGDYWLNYYASGKFRQHSTGWAVYGNPS